MTQEIGVRVGHWRGISHTTNAFAAESFLDELAEAAGVDAPVFRLRLLTDTPRSHRLVSALVERSRWDELPGPGRARGLALHEAWGSVIGQVVEVESRGGELPRVTRIVCAADVGLAVQPDQVRAQIEGGILFGLSAALGEEIHVSGGEARESNFHDYPVLRLAEAPKIEVHLLASDQPPGGVGELGVPTVAPALANAIHAATGRRLRRLPLRRAWAEWNPS